MQVGKTCQKMILLIKEGLQELFSLIKIGSGLYNSKIVYIN